MEVELNPVKCSKKGTFRPHTLWMLSMLGFERCESTEPVDHRIKARLHIAVSDDGRE